MEYKDTESYIKFTELVAATGGTYAFNAETSVQGFVLEPGAVRTLNSRAEISGENIARSIPSLLSSGLGLNLGGKSGDTRSVPPVELRGTLMLNTWLGDIPYPLRIAPK